ncbi:helix-turn-helix transcriptional regulator [Glycomyces sp. TRM65418]|uniref:Scr1 family TA system antitoxin-like transcriptional regulator n=1 Tax=Glycomyces sp. TRM65418 TaxID=2867006 RepID=UPI001D16A2EA|nr:Scr1 family TA system antitoxin-like transcriptional regulator [Glycomyces sp. TRM65418]MCC3765069.1 helix-turn-helix transcriptional regulator [Glycomyces sp. TRM65418]
MSAIGAERGIIITTGKFHSVGSAAMSSPTRYRKLIKAYLVAEINALMHEKGWNAPQLARVLGKHVNTVRSWLNGERLPDVANIRFICDETEADPARKAYMEHVREQLNQGSEVVSDLDKRNLFIVEAAERTYGSVFKWNPVLFPGLVQTEAFHMKLLPDPLDDPAQKVKHWKRKERRGNDFFGRLQDGDPLEGEFYLPASAFGYLDRLTSKEKTDQIERLVTIDSLPGCKVQVVRSPFLAPFAFESFKAEGRPDAGPDFVYVEALDQSRHVVDPEKLGLYDQRCSLLRADAQRIGRFLDG